MDTKILLAKKEAWDLKKIVYLSTHHQTSGAIPTPSHVQPRYSLIIHIDASFVEEYKPMGLGGVLRNVNGRWIHGFVKCTYISNNLMTELLSIREGLMLCIERNISACLICSDNQVAVSLLCHPTNHWCTITPLILECRELLQRLDEVKIKHVKREDNELAVV